MKKFFVVFAVFVCVALPGFSQSANSQRFKALSDSMDRTLSISNSKLENYDLDMTDSGNTKTYTSYNRKHEALKRALNESEMKLDLLIRTNDKTSTIKDERDHYESLVKQLEALKSDYDSWLKNVQ